MDYFGGPPPPTVAKPIFFTTPAPKPAPKAFELGEYTEPGDASLDEPLSWRTDPERSLSDWTIVIKHGPQQQTTYNVHRAVLAAGSRVSEYFVRMFRGGGTALSEASSRTSTIELLVTAAEAFPVYLDFVYTGSLHATSELAVALLHLADYLSCKTLFKATQAFMQRDLGPQTAPKYFSEAEMYALDKVSEAALKLCATQFLQIKTSKLLTLDPQLFVRVVQSNELKCGSEELSQRVVEYCSSSSRHAAAVDRALLAALTAEDKMPRVKPAEALKLLTLALERAPLEPSLQTRCALACGGAWAKALLPTIESEAQAAEAAEAEQRPKRQRSDGGEQATPAAVPRPLPLGSTIPATLQSQMLSDALVAASKELQVCRAENTAARQQIAQLGSDLASEKVTVRLEKQNAAQWKQQSQANQARAEAAEARGAPGFQRRSALGHGPLLGGLTR